MNKLGISWVDLAVMGVIIFGVIRGRKRGMSEELLDLIKWGLIVVVAGIFYEPVGNTLAQVSVFGRLSSYLFTYIAIALAIFVAFGVCRKRAGDKLVGSDTFGSGEYHLGMMAGAFRYLCIVLVVMALLNARHYSPAEIKESAKYQQDNFGSDFFPTIPDLQRAVFDDSACGRFVQSFLHVVLIKSTAPADGGVVEKVRIVHAREASLNEILDKK